MRVRAEQRRALGADRQVAKRRPLPPSRQRCRFAGS
jgi:hypothetical protein